MISHDAFWWPSKDFSRKGPNGKKGGVKICSVRRHRRVSTNFFLPLQSPLNCPQFPKRPLSTCPPPSLYPLLPPPPLQPVKKTIHHIFNIRKYAATRTAHTHTRTHTLVHTHTTGPLGKCAWIQKKPFSIFVGSFT